MRHGRTAVVAIALLGTSTGGAQTTELPTRGREFWLGFMQNAYGAQTLSVRIASTTATSGTVSMPLTGWSAAFTVAANSSATVLVPGTAEHTGSEFIGNKAVLVQALDSVTVTAVSFQNFTADGARVLPREALANDYMIDAYRGLPGFGEFYKSELLIVATADNTVVEITPSVNTLGGNPAGVPFTITLNTGETYQVQSALSSLDMTGTRVVGAATNGPCRAFAVFGGSMCANVPVGCQACDHLFEQMVPTDRWGTQFFTVPMGTATSWTFRILAAQNGTAASIDGGAPIALNAGQKYEVNAATAPSCITSNLPVSVVQVGEGFNCAGTGDPSMIVLTPVERLAKKVSWSTVSSPQMTAHTIALTVPSASVGTVSVDGSTVPAGSFTAYSACNGWSRAQVTVAAGTHTVQGANGFIAYALGAGTGESYAFALENNAPPVIEPDTLICAGTPITLTAPWPVVNAVWYEQSAPGTILATGSSYGFTPTQNGTYIVSGEMPVSFCPLEFSWGVGLPVDPSMQLTANGAAPATVCQFSPVQLNATPAPDPLWYDLQWSPASLVSDPTIPDPVAFPMQDTWFRLDVTSPVGCGGFTDSVLVQVDPNSIVSVNATANDSALCAGQNAQLQTQVETAVASDVLDIGTGAMWNSITGGAVTNACGSTSGNALYFNGGASRDAKTNAVNTTGGGMVRFSLKIANGTSPCDNADPGEDVVLEYSTTGGAPFTVINTYNEAAFPVFINVVEAIPAGAQGANTTFRWRQVSHSGTGQDNWAIDNVIITRYNGAGLLYNWSPAPWVNNAAIAAPIATPGATTWFHVDVTDPNSGCAFGDSVHIYVQPAFTVVVNNDTTICGSAPVQLQATPNYGSGTQYVWTPANGTLNSTTSASPIATPVATTTYAVTATSPIGCTATDAVTISVGQLTSVNVTSPDVDLCPGQSTALNAAVVASGPVNITWTPNNGSLSSTTSANPTATPAVTTTYTCTVTDAGTGCALSSSITVNVHGPYAITMPADDSLCTVLGTQLNIVHNVPTPSSYAWAPAAFLNNASIAAPTVMVDTSATYSVTITDAFGCTAIDSVTFALAFDDLITPVSMNACTGQSILLDAGYPGSTYDWNTTQTSQTITVSSSGSYVVQITDPALCQAVATFNVTFNAPPTVNLGTDTLVCGAPSLTLDAGNAGSGFLWSPGGQTTQAITVASDGTYAVSVTNAAGCSASDAIIVDFAPLPTDVLIDVSTCVSAAPVALDAGNAGSSFAWSPGGQTTQTIAVGTSGTHTVTITNPQGCSATYDATVSLLADPIVDLGADTVLCMGTPLTLDAANAGASYLWSTTATTQTIAVTTSGNYWVIVSNGACSAADTVQVNFLPLPTDNLNDVTSCVTTPVTLDAGNAGSSYQWTPGGETTQTISCPGNGTYTVLITTVAGCSATFSATVTYATPPVFNLGADTTLCDGDVLTLDAGNPGSSYLWSNGANTQQIDVTATGTYTCVVDNGFCTSSDAIDAHFNPAPDPLTAHDFYTCLDEEPHFVVIDAGNSGSSFNWSTGEETQVILAGAYGWYYVEVTNRLDCSSRDSAQVIEFCPASIYIPNTFTPNGDGINDVWGPVGKSIASMELIVFDRYGHALFTTENFGEGWDGTVNGELVKSEVYVWRITYRFLLDEDGRVGELHEQLGHVTVLY